MYAWGNYYSDKEQYGLVPFLAGVKKYLSNVFCYHTYSMYYFRVFILYISAIETIYLYSSLITFQEQENIQYFYSLHFNLELQRSKVSFSLMQPVTVHYIWAFMHLIYISF